MNKGSSNRTTQIKVVEGGKVVKTVSNVNINYGQDLEQLKKMVEISIRLSPQDPVYTAEKLLIHLGKGKDAEIDQDELEQFQSALFKQEVAPGAKVLMTVHVQKPVMGTVSLTTPSRPNSMRLNVSAGITNAHMVNNENQENKYDNALFSPTQIKRSTTPGKSRATTPNKGRAQSRGRGLPAPVARTPNLMNSSVKLNDFLKTMNDESAEEEVHNITRLVSNISPEKILNIELQEAVKEEVVDNRKILQQEEHEILAGVHSEQHTSIVPSPLHMNGNSAQIDTDITESLNVAIAALDAATLKPSADVKKSRRFSTIEIEHRKAIESSINDTWQEVGDDNDECTPTRTLAPFQYYSEEEQGGFSSESEDEVEEESQNQCIQSSISSLLDVTASYTAGESNSTPVKTESVEISTAVSPPANEDNGIEEQSKSSNNGAPKTPLKTPSKKSAGVVSSATKSVKKASSSLYPGPKKPVYPEGHTLGESSVKYEQNLRSYQGVQGSASKKKSHQQLLQISGQQADQPQQITFKMSACKKDADGRPSIGTITQQWEFMRINFVNNSDEELEWLMVSKKPGSFNYAHRKNELSEDKYFRSLFEVEFYEGKIAYFAGSSAKLPALISELNGYYNVLMDAPKCEILENKIMTAFNKLTIEFENLKKHKAFEAFLTNGPKIEESITAITNENAKFRIVMKAKEAYPGLSYEVMQLQKKLTQARKDGDDALKNMEKWARREAEVDEYPMVMKQQEEKWMDDEFVDNLEALDTMRRYLPTNIAEISVSELVELYRQNNGCISLELAQELKTNKFLHWLVTHQDDIAYANFLTGENKSFFENLEGMDLTELRALAMVLPSKFELDGDGKKNEWRCRFFARLKQLVSQFRRDKVKGAWDPNLKARAMVELPPLKPDLIRRPIYFYRTKEQSDVKLKQYDDKLALFAKKEKWLETAEKEAKDAKEEYDTVLKEMRDPDFIEMYGADKLASVKDMAKAEWSTAEKKRKNLAEEVSRLKKSIESAPVTREQFVEKEKEIEKYLSDRGVEWTEKGQNPVLIHGPFGAEKTIEKKVKASAKFLSAEEEAAIRKKELENLKAAKEEIELAPAPELDCDIIHSGSFNDDGSRSGPKKLSINFPPDLSTSINHQDLALLSADFCPLSSDLFGLSNHEVNSSTPKPTRKGSILTHTNPDLLNTLNKMFGGKASTPAVTPAKTPNRRFSVAVTGSSAKGGALFMNTDSASEAEVKKEITKKSKSKLLQRLLGKEESPKKDPLSCTGGFPLPPRPQMSFLDQIKAKAGGANDGPAPISFLDQIKARAGNQDGPPPVPPRPNLFAATGNRGTSNVSLLDQIKARREEGETHSCEVSASNDQVIKHTRGPMMPLVGPAGGMSFLDQIKSRRKED